MMTLLPRLRADNAGLVTIYNDRGTPSFSSGEASSREELLRVFLASSNSLR
jgi:hypothetical protein